MSVAGRKPLNELLKLCEDADHNVKVLVEELHFVLEFVSEAGKIREKHQKFWKYLRQQRNIGRVLKQALSRFVNPYIVEYKEENRPEWYPPGVEFKSTFSLSKFKWFVCCLSIIIYNI